MSEMAALCSKTVEQLQLEEIRRQALEDAAKRLEMASVSHSYAAAFKRAARMIRDLKP
jgi:hypothetical protein